MTKQFSLLQLFSLLDGRLSTDIGDVYEMLNHICDDSLMTHHLPIAGNYLKEKNPKWLSEVKEKLSTIQALCPIKERTPDQFKWLMRYFQTKDNPTYAVPQLKDEFDTSDFIDYMLDNSLLLKKMA